MSEQVTIAATVLQIEVDPYLRDPLRRHLARIRVEEVLSGELDSARVTLLIHSPSKTFMDPNPIGYRYLVGLTPPIDDPDTGPLEIEPADEQWPWATPNGP